MLKINARVWIAVLLIVAVLLMIGAIFLFRYLLLSDTPDKSGWSTQAGAVCYLDKNGKPLLQWQQIDGKTYYFIPDAGIRATGWKTIGNARYYFDNEGVLLTGWQTIDGNTYYLDADGKMATGLYAVDGKIYCFTEDGGMTTGWQTVGEKEYYLTEEGYALTGWTELDGVRCRFDETGAALTGWFTESVTTEAGTETRTYYFAEKGVPLAGWQTLEEKQYYFTDDGVMTTGWMAMDGDKYYFAEDGSMAVGRVEIDGIPNFFSAKGKYVLLVNHDIPVPESFVLDLVKNANGFQVDRNAKDPLEQMIKACKTAGFSCVINNTYRSKETQQNLWNRSVNSYMAQGMSYEQACAKTAEDTMTPGHSEHQTGLAVDLDGSNAAYEWLAAHCWDYGFILRYPADKMEFTGIIHEPWHFRYVGEEFAQELKASGMCLEEYMQSLTK